MGRARARVAVCGVGLMLSLLLIPTTSAAMRTTTANTPSSFAAATIGPVASASASARLTCAIDVSWPITATTWASGYHIYRSGNGGTYSFVASATPRSATSYADQASALKAGLTYVYQVRAYFGSWISTAATSNSVYGPAICGGG